MNVLFVSKDLAGAGLCYKLKKEGHDVRLFIDDIYQKQNLDGMVEKTQDWKKELNWVGKEGLIVFDSCGYGKEQDALRKKGFSVVGGNEFADKLEHDRQYGHKIFSVCGIDIVPTINFCNTREAIAFVMKNEGPWVIKQNGHTNKSFNYVGHFKDNRDVIEVLMNYDKNNKEECGSIDLQRKIDGIEIGVGRYFNGKKWVGPIEINVEHKNLFNHDLGPKTDEMGTLMWYDDNEKNQLFTSTLAKLESYLRKIDFRGDIDINCIVNGNEIFPLEATARFGCPSTQLQCEIHTSPWGDFLKAIADGKSYDLKYKKGFAIIALIATPPFPYDGAMNKYYPEGIKVLFKKKLKEAELESVHFEEVSFDAKTEDFYISSKKGYILHVSGMGDTVGEARKKTYKLIDNIVVPKMFYRTDVGSRFIKRDCARLKKWGWV
jgi:phosphoribosylamine--glycine ligase